MICETVRLRVLEAALGVTVEAEPASAVPLSAACLLTCSCLPAACTLSPPCRRQMMMDGQFGSISFICSKSDNVM